MIPTVTFLEGDVLKQLATLPDESVHCCVTSPPYWGLRDYGVAGQIGLEKTPEEYVAKMVEVFREVRRVLRSDGTCWVNLGSSYAGYWGDNYAHKPFGEDRTADASTPPNKPSMSFRKPSASRGKPPIQSRSGVPACGSDGRELQDSTAYDCACSCLCDGCRDALGLTHNENICPLHGQSASLVCTTNHDNERSDSSPMPQDASLLGAQESTMRQSSPPHQGECLHCSNCGACLSVLRSSLRDARLCVRNSWLNHTIVHPVFKPKDMVPIPWMVAMALQADGWWLRQDIIWHKPNPMPESVTDRCTKAHEYIFLLTKSERYYYDAEAIREPQCESSFERARYDRKADKTNKGRPTGNDRDDGGREFASGLNALPYTLNPSGRNKRSVWTVSSSPYPEAHFATYPPDLIKPCILAGTSAKGCCPKCGAPWERVVESVSIYGYRPMTTGAAKKEVLGDMARTTPHGRTCGNRESTTLFWLPLCDCGGAKQGLEPIPCTVLDPFAGSFTTCAVSMDLGRNAIGIELNPRYVKLGRSRCAITPGLSLS